MVANNLFCLSIFRCLWSCGSVYFFDDVCNGGHYVSLLHYFLGGVSEKNVNSRCGHLFFLQSPTFADTSFEQIPLYSTFKELFRNRNHYPVVLQSVLCVKAETKTWNIPVLAVGKQLRYSGLAAKSLLFRESMADLFVHLKFS